jgi:hypothetical protein
MFKVAIILVTLAVLAGCDTAPPPTRSSQQPYSIISEKADPSSGTLNLDVRISGAATQASVRAVVEGIIDNRRGEYRHILVKSFVGDSPATAPPYAVSRLENGEITHHFSTSAETEKIPTH